jgi:acyl-CoA reductase-like NAD-dependent aldehyde dehydrogenase
MTDYHTIYIDGQWTVPSSTDLIEVDNPATGEVIGRIPSSTAADVHAAARAARRAFPAWARTPVALRAQKLRDIAAALRDNAEEITACIISEVGTPRAQAEIMQFGIVVQTFEDAAARVTEVFELEELGNSRIVREPIGVIGAITPWNYPLYQIALKIAPALAVGCTVVLKPSEVAGLSPYLLAKIIDSVGLPAGVFNLVTGIGAEVGEAIAAHPDIDMVSFTGSDRAGKRVAEVAAATVKKVALELGGKNPMIVLDDADLESAVTYGVTSCYSNAGQTCAALSRMIVPRSRLAEVEQIAVRVAQSFAPGDPQLAETKLGPVISERQRSRVRELIDSGVREGATLLLGGSAVTESPGSGYYVAATVFSDVKPDAAIAQEEIFGPVLSVIPVDDETEAVAVANGTRYGLNAAIWSADASRAEQIGEQLNASTVYINGGKFNPSAPFGGTKGSGYGRERGRFGLEEYLRTKSYQY